MIRALIIFLLVVGVVVGGLLALRRSGSTGVPGPEVLERAAKRARELDAAEREDPKA